MERGGVRPTDNFCHGTWPAIGPFSQAVAAAAAEAAVSAGHGQHCDHQCRRIVRQSVSPLVCRHSTVNRVSWFGLWARKTFRPTLVWELCLSWNIAHSG